MNGSDVVSLIIGALIIYGAYNILKGVLIWLYTTLKLVGRILVAIAGGVLTHIMTDAIFGVGFTNFTWGSIGTALVLAMLFPNASSGGVA